MRIACHAAARVRSIVASSLPASSLLRSRPARRRRSVRRSRRRDSSSATTGNTASSTTCGAAPSRRSTPRSSRWPAMSRAARRARRRRQALRVAPMKSKRPEACARAMLGDAAAALQPRRRRCSRFRSSRARPGTRSCRHFRSRHPAARPDPDLRRRAGRARRSPRRPAASTPSRSTRVMQLDDDAFWRTRTIRRDQVWYAPEVKGRRARRCVKRNISSTATTTPTAVHTERTITELVSFRPGRVVTPSPIRPCRRVLRAATRV